MVAQKDCNNLHFNRLWDELVTKKVINTIPFKPKWNNGTGYFNDLVYESLGLKPGEMVACVTTDNHRPMFIVGTEFGNCVFFKRHGMEHHVVNCNVPHEIEIMTSGLLSTSLSEDTQFRFFNQNDNIGHYVKRVKELFIN